MEARIVDRRWADVHEELGSGRKAARAVERCGAAERIELVEHVVLLGGVKERRGGAVFAALGPTRERFVAVDRQRMRAHDRLVYRLHALLEQQREEAPAALAELDLAVQVRVPSCLLESIP